MAAIYHHINDATQFPQWLMESNPLLGWEASNDSNNYDVFIARLPRFLATGMFDQTVIWLRKLAHYVLAKHGLDTQEAIVLRRCFSTITIFKDSSDTRLDVSILVRVDMITHHLHIVFEQNDSPILINAISGREACDQLHLQRILTWGFWRSTKKWFQTEPDDLAFSKAKLLLKNHLYTKPNGDLIYQRETIRG